jgi:hypothetical protein
MQPNSTTNLNSEELAEVIHDRLDGRAARSTYSAYSLSPDDAVSPVYTLILGAGFSVGVVPLVEELMHETIGDYYYPDQTGESLDRPRPVLRQTPQTSGANTTRRYLTTVFRQSRLARMGFRPSHRPPIKPSSATRVRMSCLTWTSRRAPYSTLIACSPHVAPSHRRWRPSGEQDSLTASCATL